MAAKLNDTSKGILGSASKKIGTYQEAPGGGTPLPKGGKAPSKEWVEEHRQMQPRDEDGQFTYNSANAKGLKYGPSRGTTVPPFLKGIELTFCAPGTKLKIEGEDGIKIKIMTIDMSVEEIVNSCKEYMESEEGFAGMGKGSSITKTGRKSEAEKKAEPGQIGYVDPKTLSEGTQKKMAEAKAEYDKESSKPKSAPAKKFWEKKKDDTTKDTDTDKDTGTHTPTPDDKSGDTGDKKILDSMGLDKSDIKEEMSFNPDDTKDPKAFYSKNKDTIDSMVKEFNDIHPEAKIAPKHIIQAIRNGSLKSMDAWKKSLGK